MMTLPNILTFIRIGAVFIFTALYYIQPNYGEVVMFSLANLVLVIVYGITGITDYLDGYLARKMKLTSKFGAFLDPTADKIMVIAALILLVDFYQMWFITIPSLIIVSREVIVSALREWMSEVGARAKVNVALIGKIKTGMQISAILLLLYHQPFLTDFVFQVGCVLLFIATILTLWSGFIYLKEGLKTLDN